MRALILAAGKGTRLGKFTKNLPKGMLKFNGKPLLEWQITQLRKAGVDDINIVTGYRKEKITFPGINFFVNPDFAKTNMIESMICAREIFIDEIIITYSDILFTSDLAEITSHFNGDIGVLIDRSWREYWMMRYGTTETDLETLEVKDDRIIELGRPVYSSEGINYRYVGMLKFSKAGIEQALEIYDEKKAKNEVWMQSGNSFRNGYMTDLLNEIILSGNIVEPIICDGGWMEFDSEMDYEVSVNLLNENRINKKFFE